MISSFKRSTYGALKTIIIMIIITHLNRKVTAVYCAHLCTETRRVDVSLLSFELNIQESLVKIKGVCIVL